MMHLGRAVPLCRVAARPYGTARGRAGLFNTEIAKKIAQAVKRGGRSIGEFR